MTVSVRIVGVNRVRNNLRSMIANHKQIFDPVIAEYSKDLQRALSRKRYPPKLANQKYVRTGRLGVSYSAKKVSPAVWSIRNSAPYAAWVVDEKRQAGIHQGRWFTIQSEERKLRPELTRALTRRAEKHFDN